MADDRPVGHLQALVGEQQDTLNQHWAQGKANSFGFKMMMKMGWSDGRGLGKELQGNAKHVTVSKKVDNAGLGSVKDETGNAGWTEASASFDSVLSKLNARYGGQREAAQKKREKKDKKKGKERSKKKEGGTASGLLRHPKLLQSKNIRKYSAHDMQAILGIKRVEASPVGQGGGEAPSLWSALAGAASGAATKGGDKDKESRKKEKKDKKNKREYSSSSSSSGSEEEEEEEVVQVSMKKSKKQRVEQEEEETDGKAAKAEKKAKKGKRREEKKGAAEAEASTVSEKKKSKKKKDRE